MYFECGFYNLGMKRYFIFAIRFHSFQNFYSLKTFLFIYIILHFMLVYDRMKILRWFMSENKCNKAE